MACRQAVTTRELASWAGLAAALSQQGWDAESALCTARCQVYTGYTGALNSGAEAPDLAANISSAAAQPLFAPAAWPLPISLADWTGDSLLATIERDSALLEAHVYGLVAAQADTAGAVSVGKLGPGLPSGGLQAALTGTMSSSTER